MYDGVVEKIYQGGFRVKRFMKRAFAGALALTLVVPTSVSAATYKDISDDHWAKEAIDYLTEEGLVNGFEDGTFDPNAPVKRSQAALILSKALGLEASENGVTFNDLDENDAVYDAAVALAQAGIMEGRDGNFMPNDPLTRGQMAKVLTKAYDLNGEVTASFADVSSDHWAYEYVGILAANEITGGYDDNTFRPSNETTRAQFAVFLTNTLEAAATEPEAPEEPEEPGEEVDEEILQLLEDAFEAQLNLESYTFEGDMGITLDFPIPDDLTEEEAEMIDEAMNMDMVMRGAFQADPFITEVVIEQDIPAFGESMVLPSISTETKNYQYITDAALLGYPEEWQGKYIEMDYEEMLGEEMDFPFTYDEQMELMKEIYDVLIEHIGTDYFTLHDSHDAIPGDVDYEQVLEFTLTEEELVELFTIFEEEIIPVLEGIFSNPQLTNALGLTASEAETIQAEMEADFEEFLSKLSLDEFKIIQAFDEDANIVYDTGIIQFSFTDGEETITFGIDYGMSISNFNEPVTFEYGLPENEEDIISFDEWIEWQEEQLEELEDFEEIEEVEEMEDAS